MKEQLITFETAKLTREKGFDIPTNGRYYWDYQWKLSKKGATKCDNSDEDSYSAPTQSLLQRWLREIHNLFINVYFDPITHYHYCKIDRWNDKPIYVLNKLDGASQPEFTSYEDAMEKGLKKALKHI